MGWKSQDGKVGRHRVHVFSQLGNYRALVGDLGHLKGWEESPNDRVGCGGEEGREEKWSWDGTGTNSGRGSWGRGGVQTPGNINWCEAVSGCVTDGP